MPRKEDIERFAKVLTSLGGEPELRAAQPSAEPGAGRATPPGEEPGAADFDFLTEAGAAGPEGSAEESLQDLFAGLSAPEPDAAAEPGASEAGAPSEEMPDFGLPTDDFALPGNEPAAEGPEAETPAAEGEEAAGDLDFSSLFGEESGTPPIEDIETPAARSPRGVEKPETLRASPEEDAFAFGEEEPTGLQSDIDQMQVLPDIGEPSEQGSAGEEASGLEAPDFQMPDLGTPGSEPTGFESTEPDMTGFEVPGVEPADFEMPGFEAPGAEATGLEAPEGGADSLEGVELPSLDDLSFGEEPGAGESGAPSGESQETEEPVFPSSEETPFGEPAAAGEPGPEPSFDLDTSTEFEMPPVEAAPEEAGSEEPSFEGLPAEPSEPAPARSAVSGPEDTVEMESLGEESLGDLNLDEFSLPESAEQFGIPEAQPTAKPAQAPRRAAPRQPQVQRAKPAGVEELAGADEEIALTPEQFARIKRTLEALPRNLKIAVQDLIGEGHAKGAELTRLLGLLMAGAAAQEIAVAAGRITGKRIRIPAGYEKKSGVAFEAESRTFAYAFRENILPILRVVLLTVLAGAAVGYFGYRFIYRPLSAMANYRAGYAQIRNDRFTLANERFANAVKVWPMRAWFYRFAEGFADKRQYVLAEAKYEELLRHFPGDRKGILDYASMESTKLADYEKADALLNLILNKSLYDYDALLARGDNDIQWADTDKAKYEAARLTYATLIDKYGVKDDLLFRMLRYFIRVNNGEEVERLRSYYADRPDVKVDAAVFSELGGYLVDHRRLDYAQDVLFRAEKVDPALAEVHYNLARYYRIVGSSNDEKLALDAVIRRLQSTDPLTRKRLGMEIDTHTRLGEYYYGKKEYVTSEKELQTAVQLIEQNQKMNLIGTDRLFGRPYADMGDLSYYIQGDLAAAAAQYQKAIANHYTSPELTYKIGYTQYARQDYRAALAAMISAEDASAYPSGNEALAPVGSAGSDPGAEETAATTAGAAASGAGATGKTAGSAAAGSTAGTTAVAATPGQVPTNLLYSLGNCFFQRGDFFAAQGYFLRLMNSLETRRSAIGNLQPAQKPGDRALLDTLAKANNNLGVTMLRLSERTGDRRKRSEALVYLTASSQIADSLARSPDTVRRSETLSLSALNMRGILYPVTGFVLQIYQPIPKDFEALSW